MKKIICLLLILALSLSIVACGPKANNEATTEATEEVTTEATEEVTTEATEEVTTEAGEGVEEGTEGGETAAQPAITYFSLAYGNDYENYYTLSAYPEEDMAYVLMMDATHKEAYLDASAMESIQEAYYLSDLAALNGVEEYGEGEASYSVYISFEDDSYCSANFAGAEIPEAFMVEYNAMLALFDTLLADVPEYVATPDIMGEVDETLLNESMNILTTSGLEGLDYYMIAEILMDEDFGYAAGLSSSEGIVAGASCASGMMTCAYSMVLVTLEEGADAAAIAADFEANVDWMKWVCVQPSNALICQKDNMLLCLVADGDAYTMTATAIGASPSFSSISSGK